MPRNDCKLQVQMRNGRGGIAINGISLTRVTSFTIDAAAGEPIKATITFYPTEAELDLDVVQMLLFKEEEKND